MASTPGSVLWSGTSAANSCSTTVELRSATRSGSPGRRAASADGGAGVKARRGPPARARESGGHDVTARPLACRAAREASIGNAASRAALPRWQRSLPVA
jgi:hypothetical protein